MTNEETRRADDPRETLKAQVEAEVEAALEQASLELTETQFALFQWEVWARGPWQHPSQAPGRIIALGQKAYIATVVWLNYEMCLNVSGFGGKIHLSYHTSNTETMRPVAAMDYACCIPVTGPCPRWGKRFVHIWEFEPTEAACILETNICARICNCNDKPVPHYAGFVRWVRNFDRDLLFPPPFLTFDHPIRYLVYDNKDVCDCSVICP